MRQTCIFSGSSHPLLVDGICERLGQRRAQVDLRKFSNGETSVEIKTSVRDQDVFIVQSGCSETNDSLMELMIMISACKGGSARSITAVVPYFPYSRQSKKKAHRGAITARMLANLLHVAGVNHVITLDLHSAQMPGFFKCPVDNLIAQPLIARWIRTSIPDWRDAVVVSKNAGGTKRVTALADALKLSFGIVSADRRRARMPMSMMNSTVLDAYAVDGVGDNRPDHGQEAELKIYSGQKDISSAPVPAEIDVARLSLRLSTPNRDSSHRRQLSGRHRVNFANGGSDIASSPLAQSTPADASDEDSLPSSGLRRVSTVPGVVQPLANDDDGYEEPATEDDADQIVRDVVSGRLLGGHIVDEPPSPSLSATSRRHSSEDDPPPDMLQSVMSIASSHAGGHALGGSGNDGTHSDEEEDALRDPDIEHTITLVGNVKNRSVILVDDILDKSSSWIAAAETVVKRGGADRVYCMATHGIFGGDSLRELEMCDEIEAVIVTNTFPLDQEKLRGIRKLHVLDVSGMLAEAIRRNKHGESMEQLYQHFD